MPDNGGDVDSAGVYFMTIEEFESRLEEEMIRKSQPSAKSDPSGGDPRNSREEVDDNPGDHRGEKRRG